MVGSVLKKVKDISKTVKKIKKLQEKKFKESLHHPGLPKLHKGANIKAQIQRLKNIKKVKEQDKKRKKLTHHELFAELKGSGDLSSTLGHGNPGGTGKQVHTSPPKWKLDTEYGKGGSVRKQRRLAKRGWGVTKRK